MTYLDSKCLFSKWKIISPSIQITAILSNIHSYCFQRWRIQYVWCRFDTKYILNMRDTDREKIIENHTVSRHMEREFRFELFKVLIFVGIFSAFRDCWENPWKRHGKWIFEIIKNKISASHGFSHRTWQPNVEIVTCKLATQIDMKFGGCRKSLQSYTK